MAIYHLSAKPVQRSQGRSSTAAAAYRAGVCLADERTGEIHDYTRKQGVKYSEIITPNNKSIDREELWNLAEQAEKRKDGTSAREYEIALPDELTAKQRTELAREFSVYLAEHHGCAVDMSIHAPGKEGDQRNHHAHILCTTRCFEGGKLGAKCNVELSDSDRAKKGLPGRKAELDATRAHWSHLINNALERAGHKERVSHKSLEAQGIDRKPTVHLGPVATAMERRGEVTERGNLNRESAHDNEQLKTLKNALRELEAVSMASSMPTAIVEPVKRLGPAILGGSEFEAQRKAAIAKQIAEFEQEQASRIAANAAAEEQKKTVEFWGKELLEKIENASNKNEYREIFLTIAEKTEPNKPEWVYEKWIKPYMDAISTKDDFKKYVILAKKDATTDKKLLQEMKKSIFDALRGTGGSLSKYDQHATKIINEIRLNEDREQCFNQIAMPFMQQVRLNKGRGLGR